MQSKNPLFNDFSKVVTGAFGIAQNAKAEMETAISSMIERWLSERDLVNREEFDAIKLNAKKNAEQNDTLLEKISNLESRLAKLESKTFKKPRAKTD